MQSGCHYPKPYMSCLLALMFGDDSISVTRSASRQTCARINSEVLSFGVLRVGDLLWTWSCHTLKNTIVKTLMSRICGGM
jgi:hypothetical protein